MLKKNLRYSFDQGVPRKTYSTPLFTIRYQENTQSMLKIAVVVSKKVDKRAVYRNSIKRRLIQYLSENISSGTGITLVLYTRQPIVHASQEEIGVKLQEALLKINIV